MTKISADKATEVKPFQDGSEFEKVRGQFRALVLANPNYFGNLKESPFKPVMPIVGNTTYEEIGSVGFQPQLNHLNAVVYINQSGGYNGGICSNGSPEYVRFYASYDEGTTWDDLGISSFSAYDISLQQIEAKRLEYAVSIKFAPRRRFCFLRNLALVRAILSWNVQPPPNEPDWLPVWGEDYYSNMVLWAVPMALGGESIADFTRSGLVEKMIRAAGKGVA